MKADWPASFFFPPSPNQVHCDAPPSTTKIRFSKMNNDLVVHAETVAQFVLLYSLLRGIIPRWLQARLDEFNRARNGFFNEDASGITYAASPAHNKTNAAAWMQGAALRAPSSIYSHPTNAIQQDTLSKKRPRGASCDGQTARKRVRSDRENAMRSVPVDCSLSASTSATSQPYLVANDAPATKSAHRATHKHPTTQLARSFDNGPGSLDPKVYQAQVLNEARNSDLDPITCLWHGDDAAGPCLHFCENTDALLVHCTKEHGLLGGKNLKEKIWCRWVGCKTEKMITKGSLKRHLGQTTQHGLRKRK